MAASFESRYFAEVQKIATTINLDTIAKMVSILNDLQERHGRLFFLGVGGSAANCTHAVNDFRKIAGIECYSPVDNVAELTARINDDGWETAFTNWLKISRLSSKDALFIFSVGGGNKEKNVSANLVHAMDFAKSVGARIMSIVGRDGGYAGKVSDACIIIPTQSQDTITPHAEAWQAVVWHMLVAHPQVMKNANKWESIDKK
ncbi:MAG: SIS domain-containing protein [Oligoflexia bacterium]|nr:SIS domain-containing protein [Oligoflexia bacterium]